ncbi:hypothetical protein NQ314_020930 [Rhamnusium bicolor]|uniref:ER lumen protein-retaining receptor n=1 Tax=Rhamnusium bicolor TaxID=1586634 RepID=A0AAV8WLM9_9CUCU|nr:hypothetical protein NQ314_020930 [Rhamnusium bicolor]
MNIFRLTGDLSHLIAIIILLQKIWHTRSCAALALALLINHEFVFLEVLWTFSIYLESVAILPQLFMVSKTGEAESITSHYLFALGSYRALYILNWIYRYVTESHYDLIAIVAGIVQTVLYCDFFYLYITRGKI